MNILYIPGYRYPNSLNEPLTSGDLRYSFTLSRALAKHGHKVTVISRRDANDPVESTLDGVKIYRYKSELAKIFSTSFDISLNRYKLFKRLFGKADLVICNSPLSLEHLLPIKAPIVYVASGLEDVKNYSLTPKEVAGFLAIKLLRDPMKRRTWKKASLVNTTAWHEDVTLLRWGIPKRKIGTISSSVDLARFKPQPKEAAALRKKLKIKEGKHVILSVSRFTPAKGVLETIQAFDMLDRDDAHLVVVGVHHSHDATYYPRVVQAIKSAKRAKQISLLENIADKDLPVYYSLADVTSVFSKGYDPLPTTIIESMACGTPVVSTYYKTREQFIEDGVTGVFVKELDLKDWVEKMSNLLDNDDTRRNISTAAQKYVQDNFDCQTIADNYIRKITS